MKHTQRILSSSWHPKSYQSFKSYIDYFSPDNLVFKFLQNLPPIVSPSQIQKLRKDLKECEEGQRALLHVGDCAEPFEHVNNEILQKKINFFRTCSEKMREVKRKPSTVIGRIAGQYAKPRSNEFIIVNGKKTHNYKGDNVNSTNQDERQPSLHRLTQGYYNSTITYNFIQNMFSDLFISHQGLIIPYQSSFTKQINNLHYCLTAHMLWIGERTRQLDGAHVQFFRGIENPIGVKISSKIEQNDFCQLIRTLNPNNEKGKLLVIIRMGKDNIDKKLELLIKTKQRQNLNFTFVTDPMHGNTFQSSMPHKLKTRSLDHILEEIQYFEGKMRENRLPFGYSLEATHENVTECFGLTYPSKEEEIDVTKYTSKCDPRLNQSQLLHLFKIISES